MDLTPLVEDDTLDIVSYVEGYIEAFAADVRANVDPAARRLTGGGRRRTRQTMEIIIQPTPEQASEVAARIIAKQVRAKPDSVLGPGHGQHPAAAVPGADPHAS